MIVVADTSPLSYLILIEQIEILPDLFGSLVAPGAVMTELSHLRAPETVRRWALAPPIWVEVRSATTRPAISHLGAGECEAIALAKELSADLLLVDDKQARRVAMEQGLSITGTLGVLGEAARRGLLDLPDAINRLRRTDFKIAESVLQIFLENDAARKRAT
jgi:predicted nucleic acid-binding protein